MKIQNFRREQSAAHQVLALWDNPGHRRLMVFLLVISALVSIFRYHSPSLLYPEISDAVFVYSLSDPVYVITSIFTQAFRALMYALFGFLHPRDASFLPDVFVPLLTYEILPGMAYLMMMLGVVNFWLYPLAGFAAWKITGSRLAAVLTAMMMALSPQQNLVATAIDAYLILQFPLIWLYYRALVLDIAARSPVEHWRSGLITGCAAGIGILTIQHGWYAAVVLFPLVSIECFARHLRRSEWDETPQFWHAFRHAGPYALGLALGLIGAIMVIEGGFWFNLWTGGLLYPVQDNQLSFIGTTLEQIHAFANKSVWSMDRVRAFWRTIHRLIGWHGSILVVLSTVWIIFRRRLLPAARPVPVSLAGVLILGFVFVSGPTVPPFGRILLAFEFPIYVALSILVTDALWLSGRARVVGYAVAGMALIMGGHMMISSWVAREDVLNNGRAAEWLREHRQPMSWTSGPYAFTPKYTPGQVAALTNPQGYLIVSAVPDPEWVAVLKKMKVLPVRQWRTAKGSWSTFDLVGADWTLYTPYAFSGYIVVYDLASVARELRQNGL